MERIKKHAKTTFKFTLKTILGLIVGVLLWLFCSWLLPKIKVNSDRKKQLSGIEIFIKSNGVHTDFVLPVKTEKINWFNQINTNNFKSVDTTFKYMAFGWGDKGFFLDTPTWAELKFSTAFKAAFWLGEAAMHVTCYKDCPNESEKCKKVILSNEEYEKLITYIQQSFEVKESDGSQKSFIKINHPGYFGTDVFYEANGTYNLFKTCNEWTGDGLEVTGVKIGVWTPLQGGIMEELE